MEKTTIQISLDTLKRLKLLKTTIENLMTRS